MPVPRLRHALFVIVREPTRSKPEAKSPAKVPNTPVVSHAARLTDDQRTVFFAHLDDAVRGAYALARKSGEVGRRAVATGRSTTWPWSTGRRR
jgi:hypothetical protein